MNCFPFIGTVLAITLILICSPYLRRVYRKVRKEQSEQLGRQIVNAVDIRRLRTELETYGRVESCEEKNGKFYVVITKGFNPEFLNVRACRSAIMYFVNSPYPYVEDFRTDKDLFVLTLKTVR